MRKPLLEGLKVALVHDWLTGMRGGEKCLEVLCELFPEADLYSLIHQKGELSQTIESMPIRTSFVQKLPFGLKKYRHYLPLFPLAIEQFKLNGYELIQTWQGFVYHMTCRGSRFKDGAMRNPAGQVFMKGRESSEWLKQNLRSTRNFIRKWGHMVQHDEMMKPIIPHKYNVGFVVHNCNSQMLRELEPWCSDIYGDWVGHKGLGANDYIKKEQPDTQFDLSKKIHSQHIEPKNDVVVEFDCNLLSPQNFQILVNLSQILQESGEVGEMELEIFKFDIKSLDSYEKELVNVI